MISDNNNLPKTLQQAIRFFSDDEACIEFIASRRWADGKAICPKCGSDNNTFMASRRTWQCKNKACKKQFSVKVGTIFEDSAIGLDKWLTAMWLIVNAKNGISSYELSGQSVLLKNPLGSSITASALLWKTVRSKNFPVKSKSTKLISAVWQRICTNQA